MSITIYITQVSSYAQLCGTSDEARLTAIDLVACSLRVRTIGKADKSEPFGTPRLTILGQEDAGDAAMTLEDVAQILLLGEFRDLGMVGLARCTHHRSFSARRLTFVTRNVARSSRSYLPPLIFSPVPAPPRRRCGGT